MAALVLLLALGWWFTRDVTYVDNVKVSGLDETRDEFKDPLVEFADEFAVMINYLTDRGYAWQSGGLPILRTGGALTPEEADRFAALATVELSGSGSLAGPEGADLARVLADRGWSLEGDRLAGAAYTVEPLRAELRLSSPDGGSEQLTLEVRPTGDR